MATIASQPPLAEATEAFARGERNVNRLTDIIFYARHRERGRRPIARGETALVQEWVSIRNNVVVPALRRSAAAPPAPAPVVVPPAPVVRPPSRFTLPPDPSQLRPAPRTNVRTVPLVTGERAIETMANLITTVAARPDGWVYMANWYSNFNMTLASGRTFGQVLADCYVRGGTIRALFWQGTLKELDPILDRILVPFKVPLGMTPFPVERTIRDMIASKYTNKDVNTATAAFINRLGPRAAAGLDDETRPLGSHHQKILVVGNNDRIDAVMGGVDWHQNRVRAVAGDNGTPLWDIGLQLDGEAAADLMRLFELRWRADASRGPIPTRRAPAAAPAPGGATVQIAPNFGCKKPLTTVPRAIRGGNTLIANLFRNCRRFFYAEDQYGIGNVELERGIRQAFENGARYGIVVLANTLAVGDIPEIAYRRYQFWSKFPQIDRNLLVFDRVGDTGHPFGPHAYVHSKFVLVDDEAATIASVNMNRRSWYNDSELACLITDAPDLIRGLRLYVWSQHLSLRPGEDIRDPAGGLAVWRSRWDDNPPTRRLQRISFTGAVPPRMSAGVPSIHGYTLPGLRSTVDNLLDIVYDRVVDPSGPLSC